MDTSGEAYTVRQDVDAVQDFMSQVRTLCSRLLANPFNTPAAEALIDLLTDQAPTADLALERVLQSVIRKPTTASGAVLDQLLGAPPSIQMVSTAA